MSEPDLLFSVRNNFYLGAFQAAIAEASDLEGLSDAEKIERDCYVYRAYIELGSYELVINEVSGSSPMALQAVKLLAEFQGQKRSTDSVLQTLDAWTGEPAYRSNAMMHLVAGVVHAAQDNYVEALRACHPGLSLELQSLAAQLYLKIDRAQQAEEQVRAMSALDEDATLTQLTTAWVNLYLGGKKVEEAFFIFQELGDKYSWTFNGRVDLMSRVRHLCGLDVPSADEPAQKCALQGKLSSCMVSTRLLEVRLFNGSALANMRMGRFDEAEQALQEALEKDPKSADTLANLITASLHLGKPVSRHSNQLKTIAPNHLIVKKTAEAEEAFTNAASGFAG